MQGTQIRRAAAGLAGSAESGFFHEIRPCTGATVHDLLPKLEREVGAALFERQPRGVTLTEAGKVLMTEARVTLDSAQTALHRTRQAGRAQGRMLRIGMVNGAPQWLGDWIDRLVEACPLLLHAAQLGGSTSEQLELLRQGRLDIAMVRPPFELGVEHDQQTLVEEELGVVVTDDHPLAGRERIEPADLSDYELIWFPPHLAPGFHHSTLTALRDAGADIRLSDTMVPKAQLKTVLTRHRQAFAIGSVRFADAPGFVWRPVRSQPIAVRIAAVWRVPVHDDAVRHVVERLRRELAVGPMTTDMLDA
ncbi:MAG TPA: LysR substrate-binding domain-containing protein [Actinocrinis sp.]|jgi:DNA-binding transcriptional LysR family regulator